MSRLPSWTKGGPYSSLWRPTPEDFVEVWEADGDLKLKSTWCVHILSKDLRLTGRSETVAKAKIDAAHYYRVLKEASKT